MSIIFDLLISNLSGVVPKSFSNMPKERAYEELKSISGEDWGYDVKAWRARRVEIEKKIDELLDTPEARELKAKLLRKLKEASKII